MTAEPRDVEEIRADIADLAGVLDDLAGVCSTQGRIDARAIRNSIRTRLAADVEPLLDRLAAADRENAELRGEVENLRARVAMDRPLCRCQPPRCTEREEARAQLAAAQAQLAEAQTALTIIRVWANTKHGGAKTPAEVWPGLDAALSAAPQPEPERSGSVAVDLAVCECHAGQPSAEVYQCRYGGGLHRRKPDGSLWHHPGDQALRTQPEPPAHADDCPGCAYCPEPPASDEPAPSWHVSPDTPDLMAALRASVEAAKKRRTGPAASGTPDGGGS